MNRSFCKTAVLASIMAVLSACATNTVVIRTEEEVEVPGPTEIIETVVTETVIEEVEVEVVIEPEVVVRAENCVEDKPCFISTFDNRLERPRVETGPGERLVGQLDLHPDLDYMSQIYTARPENHGLRLSVSALDDEFQIGCDTDTDSNGNDVTVCDFQFFDGCIGVSSDILQLVVVDFFELNGSGYYGYLINNDVERLSVTTVGVSLICFEDFNGFPPGGKISAQAPVNYAGGDIQFEGGISPPGLDTGNWEIQDEDGNAVPFNAAIPEFGGNPASPNGWDDESGHHARPL